MVMVYLIPSNNLLVQYTCFTLMIMMYSIPIPMSYLLNEKRVKDIIIQDGWIAGVKAIFDTPEKIRKLETDRFLYSKVVRNDKDENTPKVVKVETTAVLDGNVVHTNISQTESILPSKQVRYYFFYQLYMNTFKITSYFSY